MKNPNTDLRPYLTNALESHSDKVAFSIYRRGYKSFTYLELINLALEVAEKIKLYKLRSGDKIALLMDSCPEYAAVFFATGLLKLPLVLIDPKIGVKEMQQILFHSDARVLVSGFGMTATAQDLASQFTQMELCLINDLRPKELTKVEARQSLSSFEGHKCEDQALLVYTSGTTSNPKGVMVSWGNLIFDGKATIDAVVPNKDAVFLSILPMNHLLEFTVILMQFYLGAHVVFANTLLPTEISDRLKDFKYTDMVVVPLFLRSLRNSIMKEFQKSKAKLTYLSLATKLSRLIPIMGFRRLIFYPVLKKLGFLKRFISGGAPLEKDVQDFFFLMGIVVCQGYGLTETSPVSTVTYAGSRKLGTVGKPIPGGEVKISERGEILIRGPHVMMGYYKRPDLTAEVIDNEQWFHSGDLGYFDNEGNLFITGRIKELVVLGNGKKVFPDEVEMEINSSDKIKELVVIGAREESGPLQGTEVLCAVVVPSDHILAAYADQHALKELLTQEIRKKVENLALFKRPSKILISYEEFPKTSTRKNKRLLIKKMIEEGAYNEPRIPHHPRPELQLNYSPA